MKLFRRHAQGRRVLVLGLDCASPDLIFHQFKADLPTLNRLMSLGTWGELASSIPCITVPAWSSMLSSRDPGVLGVYGFRNRADYTYQELSTANGDAIKIKRVWDYLPDKTSIILNVPQTYPARPLNGALVTDFLTPSLDSSFTYPATLKTEVLRVVPDYRFDVKNFRTDDKARLLRDLHDMTDAQTALVKHLITSRSWDFFMHVNIGVDRVHHGFWRFHDPAHRLYTPGNPFESAIRDYYRRMDAFAAELIELAGDDTIILIVSDHGVARMDGGICINEWLWRNGWLALKTPPPDGVITRFDDAQIDWSKTRAWASGGYYGRVFLNAAGREPDGIIHPAAYEATRDELAAAIRAIPGDHGQPLQHHIFKPNEIYQQVNGIAPDLMVYFGDLHWRAVGSFGHGGHFTLENDTGPDDANHHPMGMFILFDPRASGRGCVTGHQLMDIAPTLLMRMGVKPPPEMQGSSI
jgi:predicted AlkP superfamily phosphohydrolase/phosphomutase